LKKIEERKIRQYREKEQVSPEEKP